jgi:hypothetical protein
MAEESASLVAHPIGNTTTEPARQPSPPLSCLADVFKALDDTAQSVNELTSLPKGTDLRGPLPGDGANSEHPLSALQTNLTRLHEALALYAEADQVLSHITRLADQRTTVRSFLSHFDNELSDIVQDIYRADTSGGDNDTILRKVFETCHRESLHVSGKLHPEHYFMPLREAARGQPYHPELDISPEAEMEIETDAAEDWTGFWEEMLRDSAPGTD